MCNTQEQYLLVVADVDRVNPGSVLRKMYIYNELLDMCNEYELYLLVVADVDDMLDAGEHSGQQVCLEHLP